MTEWIPVSIDRLFELYERHFDCLLQDVEAANLSLGSPSPKKTLLPRLTRTQFEAVVTDPANDREAIHLFVRRIMRGHGDELPARQAAC
jgi:predicted methyltransferase